MIHLDIAEVARQSGIPASTLRFYDEKGLIASTGRRRLLKAAGSGAIGARKKKPIAQ